MKFKDISIECTSDWFIDGKKISFDVKEIPRLCDSSAVELLVGGSPCECLPIKKGGRV